MPSNPSHPSHPERVCWGCDEYCPADDLTCGKDTARTPHPAELFGDDWQEWAPSRDDAPEELARSRVVEALRGVLDPEVGINIVDQAGPVQLVGTVLSSGDPRQRPGKLSNGAYLDYNGTRWLLVNHQLKSAPAPAAAPNATSSGGKPR